MQCTQAEQYQSAVTNAADADFSPWYTFVCCETDVKLQKLEQFLLRAKPSQVKRTDGVGWISINNVRQRRYYPDPEGAIEEWENYEGSKTLDYINYLAQKYEVLSAKWMPRFSSDRVDQVAKNLPCLGIKESWT